VLVGRADDRCDVAEGRRCAEDPLANERVLPDELPLALVELASLLEDLVGDGQLPEVVEPGGPGESVELVAAEAESPTRLQGQGRDAVEVLLQRGVAEGKRLAERLQRPVALGAARVLLRVQPLVRDVQRTARAKSMRAL